MLAAEKQHFTWFKFPLRVNTAKGEMCHLSWADKGSKQNLQRGHHHPLFWPWTGMCFRKTCKTRSVFCSPGKNNERTLEGHTWEECTNSSFLCDDGVQVYIGHFFSVSIVLRHFRALSTAIVFKRETRTSVSNLHWSKTIKQTYLLRWLSIASARLWGVCHRGALEFHGLLFLQVNVVLKCRFISIFSPKVVILTTFCRLQKLNLDNNKQLQKWD